MYSSRYVRWYHTMCEKAIDTLRDADGYDGDDSAADRLRHRYRELKLTTGSEGMG